MVGMVWFELVAPHAVLSNRVSATCLDRHDIAIRSARRADWQLGLNVHQARRHEEDAVAQQASLARLVRMNWLAPRPRWLHRRKLLQGSRGF